MAFPIGVTFRRLAASPAAETRIRQRSKNLGRYSSNILRCETIVVAPHRHQRKGELYDVRIHLMVPGEDLYVNLQGAEEDVYVAIRNAFDAARRELEDYERRRRGKVKRHEEPPSGHIVKLFGAEGYGFIKASDGREIYFHRNSVVDRPFEALRLGAEVRFAEEKGAEGPQATTVHVIEIPAPRRRIRKTRARPRHRISPSPRGARSA
jgi:cold shock CspA family protein/ribosome-associated translation inhibitor RaiA